MQSYSIKDYSVEFDRTATVDWYEKYEGWVCDCGDCQSFLAWVRQKQLPPAVIELLQIFGALPEKPTYVCELSPTARGHLYQFNYRVVGCMLNDPHHMNLLDLTGVRYTVDMKMIHVLLRIFLNQTSTLCFLWIYHSTPVRKTQQRKDHYDKKIISSTFILLLSILHWDYLTQIKNTLFFCKLDT